MAIEPLPDYRSPEERRITLFIPDQLPKAWSGHQLMFVDTDWANQSETVRQQRVELTPIRVLIQQLYVYNYEVLSKIARADILIYANSLLQRLFDIEDVIKNQIRKTQARSKSGSQPGQTAANRLQPQRNQIQKIQVDSQIQRKQIQTEPTAAKSLEVQLSMLKQAEKYLIRFATTNSEFYITEDWPEGDPRYAHYKPIYTKLRRYVFTSRPSESDHLKSEIYQMLADQPGPCGDFLKALYHQYEDRVLFPSLQKQQQKEQQQQRHQKPSRVLHVLHFVPSRLLEIAKSGLLWPDILAKLANCYVPPENHDSYDFRLRLLSYIPVDRIRSHDLLGHAIRYCRSNHELGSNNTFTLRYIQYLLERLREDASYWPGIKQDLLWAAESNPDLFALLDQLVPDVPANQEPKLTLTTEPNQARTGQQLANWLVKAAQTDECRYYWGYTGYLTMLHPTKVMFRRREPVCILRQFIRARAWLAQQLNVSLASLTADKALLAKMKRLGGVNAIAELTYYQLDGDLSTNYTLDERYAIFRYSKNSRINAELREHSPLKINDAYYWDQLQRAFRHTLPLTKNMNVYRGFSGTANMLTANHETVHVLSTTSDPEVALQFTNSNCCLMRLVVKRGTPIINMAPYTLFVAEREILLPPGELYYESHTKERVKGKLLTVVNYLFIPATAYRTTNQSQNAKRQSARRQTGKV